MVHLASILKFFTDSSHSWIAGSGSPCVLTIRELRISLPHVTPRPFKRLRGTDIRGRKLNALDAKIEQGKQDENLPGAAILSWPFCPHSPTAWL